MGQFDAQRHRGVQGFGLFDGQEMNMAHASKEDKILNWLCKYDSNLLLFHHRYPTSTINVKRAAHPFSTKDYFGDTQYILVHNGGITNADDLFDEHQELGIEYKSLLEDMSFNDSEALLWDFALFMEGKRKALTAEGRIAFVCLKLVKGKLEKMYFGRNDNPLVMYRDAHGITLSSEGDGEPIDSDKLYTWNYALKRLTKRNLTIPRYTHVSPAYTPVVYSNAYPNYGSRWDDNDWRDDLIEDEQGTWNYHPSAAQQAGNWLSTTLRAKFPDFFAEQDAQAIQDEIDEAEELKLLQSMSPSSSEVQNLAMDYLTTYHGHFEQAYWAIEDDYDNLEFYNSDSYEILVREKLRLEAVMEFIQSDPEYVNEESVSSIWEAIWQQQTLAA